MPEDGTQYSPYEVQITALGEALGLAKGGLGDSDGDSEGALDSLGKGVGGSVE